VARPLAAGADSLRNLVQPRMQRRSF
jgi:hypothetical protein